MSKMYDVIVIGSGIAGLTATKQLLQSKRGLAIANIEAESFGGLVMNVNELDGKIQGSGIEVASNLMVEITDLGATMLSERVEVLAEDVGHWTVTTTDGAHRARAVIVASGASLKKLGIPGENEFEYKGVSRCADCDGPMFREKDVVVAGGGDSALQEARVLAAHCRQVHVLTRTEHFSARPHLTDAIRNCANVKVRHLIEVNAILGNETVEKVRIRNLANNAESEIACSGFFGFIGLRPASGFVPDTVPRDADGYLIADPTLKAGNHLFVAGAVRSGHGGLLENAIADGLGAADAAMRAVCT